MEPSSNFKKIPPSLISRQEETRTSKFDKSVSRDSTVVSNNSTAIVNDINLTDENMNPNRSTDEKDGNNITVKLEDYNNSKPTNTNIKFQRAFQETDSDYDLSPDFTSPHTLKHNLLDQIKIPDCKNRNNNNADKDINNSIRSEYMTTGTRTTSGAKKRNISVLRKQLGEPLPLPYKVKQETISNSIPMRRPSIKYVSPIRKQTLKSNLPNTPQTHISPLKPLTMERLEEKRNIIANRWKDLLIKDKIRVEEKLKQLRTWDGEDNLTPLNRKRHHSLPSHDSTELQNLRKPSNESSIFNTDGFNQLDSLDNISDMSDISVLKLHQEVETNSQKLDRILAVLEGKDDVANNSTGTKQIGIKFNQINFSLKNLLWTISIIILLICQLYVLFYL